MKTQDNKNYPVRLIASNPFLDAGDLGSLPGLIKPDKVLPTTATEQWK